MICDKAVLPETCFQFSKRWEIISWIGAVQGKEHKMLHMEMAELFYRYRCIQDTFNHLCKSDVNNKATM